MLDPGLTGNELALHRQRIGRTGSENWQFVIKEQADDHLRMAHLASGNSHFTPTPAGFAVMSKTKNQQEMQRLEK